jgi:hypothetical protein
MWSGGLPHSVWVFFFFLAYYSLVLSYRSLSWFFQTSWTMTSAVNNQSLLLYCILAFLILAQLCFVFPIFLFCIYCSVIGACRGASNNKFSMNDIVMHTGILKFLREWEKLYKPLIKSTLFPGQITPWDQCSLQNTKYFCV